MTALRPALARALFTCRRLHTRPTRHVLIVNVRLQLLHWMVRDPAATPFHPGRYRAHRRWPASTSRFGIGQRNGSQRTPLGLHRIARKIGDGWPVGTAFRARLPVGFIWKGVPTATIAHRILWLDGLEPGVNRGGEVDTFRRYIYIHGLADEPTLGRPASHGCIHLAAAHLLPLFDAIPLGSLVWIEP